MGRGPHPVASIYRACAAGDVAGNTAIVACPEPHLYEAVCALDCVPASGPLNADYYTQNAEGHVPTTPVFVERRSITVCIGYLHPAPGVTVDGNVAVVLQWIAAGAGISFLR